MYIVNMYIIIIIHLATHPSIPSLYPSIYHLLTKVTFVIKYTLSMCEVKSVYPVFLYSI